MNTNFRIVLIAGLMLVTVLAGCSPASSPAINIEGAYGHPSMMAPGSGGLFMMIKNTGNAPDKLLSGKSAACKMVEIHEMVKKADGTMGMNLIDHPVDVPAGGQLELKDGGMHVMCMKYDTAAFKPGGKIDLTLVFEKSGEKTISAEIREK